MLNKLNSYTKNGLDVEDVDWRAKPEAPDNIPTVEGLQDTQNIEKLMSSLYESENRDIDSLEKKSAIRGLLIFGEGTKQSVGTFLTMLHKLGRGNIENAKQLLEEYKDNNEDYKETIQSVIDRCDMTVQGRDAQNYLLSLNGIPSIDSIKAAQRLDAPKSAITDMVDDYINHDDPQKQLELIEYMTESKFKITEEQESKLRNNPNHGVRKAMEDMDKAILEKMLKTVRDLSDRFRKFSENNYNGYPNTDINALIENAAPPVMREIAKSHIFLTKEQREKILESDQDGSIEQAMNERYTREITYLQDGNGTRNVQKYGLSMHDYLDHENPGVLAEAIRRSARASFRFTPEQKARLDGHESPEVQRALEDHRNILADKKIKEIEYGRINKNAKYAAKYGERPPEPTEGFINPIIEDGHPRVLAALAKSYIPLNKEQRLKLLENDQNGIAEQAMNERYGREVAHLQNGDTTYAIYRHGLNMDDYLDHEDADVLAEAIRRSARASFKFTAEQKARLDGHESPEVQRALEDHRNILADKKIKEIEYGSINKNAKDAAKYGEIPPRPNPEFINPIIEDGHPRVLAALAKSYIPLNKEQRLKLLENDQNGIAEQAMNERYGREVAHLQNGDTTYAIYRHGLNMDDYLDHEDADVLAEAIRRSARASFKFTAEQKARLDGHESPEVQRASRRS